MKQDLRDELHRLVDELDESQLVSALARLMAEQGRPALSRAEGLAALDQLWGPPAESAEQARADAWALRTLGIEGEPDGVRRRAS